MSTTTDTPTASTHTPIPNSRKVLHVGCGQYIPEKLHKSYREEGWQEIRLDINPAVAPDIVGDMTEMPAVETASMDAVWSSHNLEHVYPHQVPLALGEFFRVLKPGGHLLITLPDLQAVARHVAEGNLEEPLYVSPAGPVSAIDILYGFRPSLAKGNLYMAHKTGFTAASLSAAMGQVGFEQIKTQSETLNLWAVGFKPNA